MLGLRSADRYKYFAKFLNLLLISALQNWIAVVVSLVGKPVQILRIHGPHTLVLRQVLVAGLNEHCEVVQLHQVGVLRHILQSLNHHILVLTQKLTLVLLKMLDVVKHSVETLLSHKRI